MKRITAWTTACTAIAVTVLATAVSTPAHADTLVAQDTSTPATATVKTQLVGVGGSP